MLIRSSLVIFVVIVGYFYVTGMENLLSMRGRTRRRSALLLDSLVAAFKLLYCHYIISIPTCNWSRKETFIEDELANRKNVNFSINHLVEHIRWCVGGCHKALRMRRYNWTFPKENSISSMQSEAGLPLINHDFYSLSVATNTRKSEEHKSHN